MSDKEEIDQASDLTSDDLPKEELQFDAEHRDWVLQTIVGLCNALGIEASITLMVEGTFISGHLCSPEAYFDGILSDIKSGTTSGPTGDQGKQFLEERVADMKKLVTHERNEEGTKLEPRVLRPRYVHLRGARAFAVNDVGRPYPGPDRGLWWRGKIASVSGFFWGMPFRP